MHQAVSCSFETLKRPCVYKCLFCSLPIAFLLDCPFCPCMCASAICAVCAINWWWWGCDQIAIPGQISCAFTWEPSLAVTWPEISVGLSVQSVAVKQLIFPWIWEFWRVNVINRIETLLHILFRGWSPVNWRTWQCLPAPRLGYVSRPSHHSMSGHNHSWPRSSPTFFLRFAGMCNVGSLTSP